LQHIFICGNVTAEYSIWYTNCKKALWPQ